MTPDPIEMASAFSTVQEAIRAAEAAGLEFVAVNPNSGAASVPANALSFVRFKRFDLFVVAASAAFNATTVPATDDQPESTEASSVTPPGLAIVQS